MTTGHRFDGPDALAAGLVDATDTDTEVLTTAIARLTPSSARAPPLKTTMYSAATSALS